MTFNCQLDVHNNYKIFCFANDIYYYRVLVSCINIFDCFFFNFAEMMLISTLTNVFQKFSQDDEIINFTREMREPVVSQYDTKNNLFSKF